MKWGSNSQAPNATPIVNEREKAKGVSCIVMRENCSQEDQWERQENFPLGKQLENRRQDERQVEGGK